MTKKSQRDRDLDSLADALGALGDRKRLRVVLLLAQEGELFVRELCERTGVYSSHLSYHLSVLKGANLVNMRRDGSRVYYSLNPRLLTSLADNLFPEGIPL